MDDDADLAARLRVRLRWLVGCSVVAIIVVAGWFAYGAIVRSPGVMTVAAGCFAAVVTGWSSLHASLTTRLDLIAAQADTVIDVPGLLSGPRDDRRPDIKNFPIG